MNDADLPQPGALIGGRYRIESLLGQGGMGAVFAAQNEATGRAVALKWMLPSMARSREAVARFMAEARATAKIEHPNVIGIFDVGEDHGAPFLVMERLRGESLSSRLRRGRLSPAEALAFLIPACKGVAEAHAEGVLHRDLKPAHIFLCPGKDGELRAPKVLDFGISKLYDTDDGAPSLTQTGIAMGTPTYMSPEQLNAPKNADPRFDVYAMGVVCYECLTGRPPYEAEGLFMLVQQIAAGNPMPIRAIAPEVPPELEAAVMRAMHVYADYRYPTMRDFVAELERIAPSLGSFNPASVPVPARGPVPMMSAGPGVTPHPGMHPGTHPGTGPLGGGGGWSQPVGASMGSNMGGVAAPMGYPPTGGGPMPMTGAQPARGGGVGMALIGVVAVVGLLLVAAVGGGAALYFAGRDAGGGGGGGGPTIGNFGGGSGTGPTIGDPTPPAANPRAPDIGLTFSGDCHPRFDQRVMVLGGPDSITVTSTNPGGITGSITMCFPGIQGTTNISTRQRVDNQTVLNMMVGQQLWTNMALDSGPVMMGTIPDPISGSVTVAEYDSNLARVDVTFSNVALQDMRGGSLCIINGRLQTRGTTYGM